MLCFASVCGNFLKQYLLIIRINPTVNYDYVLRSWSMQLHGLIIIAVAASVFEKETNTEHTAKCDWIMSSSQCSFSSGSFEKSIIIK